MRKINFLLTLFALFMGGVNYVNAQETPENNGVYYLYNQSSGLFLTRGNNWGTQAVARPVGLPWKVTLSDGKYKLQMYDLTVAGSNSGFGDNAFTDNGNPLQFTPDGNASNGFTLQNGSNYITCPATADVVTLSSTSSAWQFLTQEQYNTVLAARATAQDNAIATAKGIVIPAGKTLNDVVSDVNNWASTLTNDGTPSTNSSWSVSGVPSRGGTQNWGNYGGEIYQGGGTYNKTISGLKPGIYKVSVRGMKRVGSNANCYNMGQAGYPVSDAFLDANGFIIPIKAWSENCVNNGNPDNTGQFLTIVNNGGYTTEGFVKVGDDGNLVLKASSEAYWGGSWFLFNGISYTFYNNEVSDDDATTILSQANTLAEDDMQASIKSELINAKNTFDGARTIANYNTLSTAITNANTSKNAYANAKAYLDEAATILAGTNVYTTSAYNTYYAEPKAKYEAGTLTTDEANALVKTSTGWHSVNTIDDILLSAWTIGGEQCENYDKALYINTWSVEGVTDGSNFLTPFFEYWIDDAKSLGANTIQATITGLKPSTTYSFTIRARVRQTNSKTKISNGITMKVGEGNAIDISAGTIFGTGPFFIGNFSAVGETDAEGKLTCTITVAENSNISWLSFYNAKYTEGEDLSAYIADYEFALNTATTRRDDAAFAAVTGKERADLIEAISTYGTVDNTSKTALITAKEALENASNTFVAAAAVYNAFAELNKNVAATLGVDLPTITNSTVAADLDIESYIVAEYNAAKTYAKSYTLGAWTNAPGTNKGESWDGTTGNNADTYFDEYDKANRAMTQTVTLPVGNYALIAKGRASENGLLTLTVGEETVTFPHKSSTGRGIATDGTATFDPAATYANSNNGRGWEYRVLTFTSDGETPTTLTFNWITANKNWCGLDDIELLYNPTALDYSALQTAFDNVELPNFGFEKDEYAPYTNAENLKLISTVEGILANQDATSQNAINNYVTALQEIIWTANAEEVNAIAFGDLSKYETVDGKDYPYGWSKLNDNSRIMGGSEGTDNAGLAASSTGKAMLLKYNASYGETTGYTLPLKAGKIYKLTFKYCGWGNNPTTDIILTDPNGNPIALAPGFRPATNNGHSDAANWYDYTGYFTSTTAGDYVLTLKKVESGQQQIAWADMELKSASEIVFADGAVPTYAPGNYPKVKIERTLTADKWATAVYPFAVSGVEKIAVLNSYDAATGQLNFTSANSSTANEPFLMRSETGLNEISLTDVEVEAIKETPSVVASELHFIGSYAKVDITNAEKNYVLSENTIYPVGENAATINPYRAYFQVDQEGEARALTLFIDGEVTGISELVKMSNEQQGQVYDLQGRKVEKTAKGLYIKNGKKVVVK